MKTLFPYLIALTHFLVPSNVLGQPAQPDCNQSGLNAAGDITPSLCDGSTNASIFLNLPEIVTLTVTQGNTYSFTAQQQNQLYIELYNNNNFLAEKYLYTNWNWVATFSGQLSIKTYYFDIAPPSMVDCDNSFGPITNNLQAICTPVSEPINIGQVCSYNARSNFLGDFTPIDNLGTIQNVTTTSGDFFTINVIKDYLYTLSTCNFNWNTQIEVYSIGGSQFYVANNYGCGTGSTQAALQWRPSFTGTVEVHLSELNCIYDGNKPSGIMEVSSLGTTYVVNTTDSSDDGVCSSNHCSLIEASNAALADGKVSKIEFNIPGTAPFELSGKISTDGSLTVDGYSQPNFQLGDIILKDGIHSVLQNCDGLTNYTTSFVKIYGIHFKGTGQFSGISILAPYNVNIGSTSKSNIFSNQGSAIQFLNNGLCVDPSDPDYNPYYGLNNKITNNYFGVDSTGKNLEENRYAVLIEKDIYTEIRNNIIKNTSYVAVVKECTDNVVLSQNIFECNYPYSIINYQYGNSLPPQIDTINSTTIKGKSGNQFTAALIEIYKAGDCETNSCEGTDYLGSVWSDNNGNWSFPTPNNINAGDRLTATVTYTANSMNIGSNINGGCGSTNIRGFTSNFSECKIILPDDCTISERLPVNKNSCSTTGIVLDLKQLTLSTESTQSTCGSTLTGNDAWYQIQVPSTGNFQVRSNINNTVNPVIEAYTGICGNLNLVDCAEIDSLPKTMVFENYTAGNTVYLRVWDKNNTITDSENTALLHLTAHELPLNKDEWELCDQENNLINGNPTILSERDANSFILEYEPNATPADIAAIEQELLNDGSTLSESCLCNGVPLQLWKSGSPIDVEDRRRRMKSRTKVDTTNYNYVFETIEFQVNAYAIGEQYATDVAMDAEGNFAMVWIDQQRRHNYGRVYKSSGNPITQEFQLGTSDKTQYNSSIAMDDNGDFVAVWHEINPAQAGATFAVYGRQYNADGTPKNPSFDISTPSANSSSDQDVKDIASLGANAQVAVDGSGNFNVVWHVGSLIFAQRLDNSGSLVGNIIEVGTIIDNNISPNPSIGVNDSGEFIIVWNGQDTDETGIYAQQYSANGTPVGSAISVNSFDVGEQSHPDVVLANDGSFVVTWESFEQEGAGLDYGIYAQIFDSGGTKVGTEFLVNSYTTDAQRHPSISLFDDGSFVIAWSSRGQDGFEEGIYAKVFDANGNPITPPFNDSANGSVGEEFRMNSYEEPEQEKPSTATNGSNIMIGAWEDGANDGSFKGIFAQRYEILPDNTNTKIFYPIGTATPSTLLGDQLDFPVTVYTPSNAVKRAKVAIIDTGIDEDHSHLVNALWTNPATNDGDNCVIGDVYGYDFVNEAGTPIDLDGHGTKVSGIVTRDFDTGVQLELMSLKFHELNRGKVFDAICAIYYAVDNGAEILNLSWGFEAAEYPAILNKALKYASDQGVLIITTAGNTSKNNDKINKFPANLNIENMIVVTSYEYRQSDGSKRLANYASYGQSQVDIAAYGYVESPKAGGGLEPSAGTSLAAPMVARTAATIKGLYPILTATEIKDCILSSAEQVAAFSTLVSSGGILDHDAALACAQTKHDMITAAACATSGLGATSTIIHESCAGMDGNISLTTSGTDPNPSFCWSNAETTSAITNLVPGSYTVTITDESRCVTELTFILDTDCTTADCQTNLVVNNNPIADDTYQSDNTIVSAGTVPPGGDVTFKAEQSITLQPGFQVSANADFLAIIEVCPPSSFQELPEQLKINQTDNIPNSLSAKVYPNPTFDQLTVEVFKDKQGFQLEVFDVMGRLLNRWNIRENQATLSVQQLNAGMYYLRIDEKLIEKVVVGNK